MKYSYRLLNSQPYLIYVFQKQEIGNFFSVTLELIPLNSNQSDSRLSFRQKQVNRLRYYKVFDYSKIVNNGSVNFFDFIL